MIDIGALLEGVGSYLEQRGFSQHNSPGLLQPKFGYAYSPSAGHHVIDKIVVSESEPQDLHQFNIVPDRSIRVYDLSKIGISRRHLSFFETIVFGYAGAAELIPKEAAVKELYTLCLELKLDLGRLLITVFGGAKESKAAEDDVLYETWLDLLGPERVKKTRGRRNLFYSRVIGSPGGTGCELYYQIGDEYVEIGSQVNYKFEFTGTLKHTRNQAILQGFGLERLLMALENRDNIGDISMFEEIKEVLRDFLQSSEEAITTDLYNESLVKIVDHLRALCFISMDSQDQELTKSQKRIKNSLIKGIWSELDYLGIYDEKIIEELVYRTVETFEGRYSHLDSDKIIRRISND